MVVSVYRSGLRNRKKDRNRTGPDRLGPDRRLRLRTFQIEGPRLRNRLQPVLRATGSARRYSLKIPSK